MERIRNKHEVEQRLEHSDLIICQGYAMPFCAGSNESHAAPIAHIVALGRGRQAQTHHTGPGPIASTWQSCLGNDLQQATLQGACRHTSELPHIPVKKCTYQLDGTKRMVCTWEMK